MLTYTLHAWLTRIAISVANFRSAPPDGDADTVAVAVYLFRSGKTTSKLCMYKKDELMVQQYLESQDNGVGVFHGLFRFLFAGAEQCQLRNLTPPPFFSRSAIGLGVRRAQVRSVALAVMEFREERLVANRCALWKGIWLRNLEKFTSECSLK